MDHPPLGRNYLVVVPSYDMSYTLILLTGRYGWDSMADIGLYPSTMGSMFGVWMETTLGARNGPYAIGSRLFGSSAVVGCVMCLDSLKWALLVRFDGRCWYQSFIDRSNIWGVYRTDSWHHEMDHPPLGCSYLVVVLSSRISCTLVLLTRLCGWASISDIDINPPSMGPMFEEWIGLTVGVPKWTIRHWVAVFGRSAIV